MSERERTPEEWAYAYDGTFQDTKMHYYMVTYWGKIYDKIHPKHTKPGTQGRKMCLIVLKEALSWHLEHTCNGDERTKIKHALTEIEKYAD